MFLVDLPLGSIVLEDGQVSRAVEDGEMAVGILMDPDLGLDVVVTVSVLGDLQAPPLVADGVVVADGGGGPVRGLSTKIVIPWIYLCYT